jgi:hypothetical protein
MNMRNQNFGGVVVIVGIIGTMMLVAFATLGGLMAVPMFEKRKNVMYAPQPPYGGPRSGYR